MGLCGRDGKLAPMFVLLAVLIAGTALDARAEEFKVLPPEACASFFRKILKKKDDDLALIPFAERSLNDIYAVLNAPHGSDRKLIEAVYAADIRRMGYRLRALSSSVEAVDKEIFKLLNTEFKVFEKMIGDSVFEMEMLTAIRTDPALRPFVTPAIEMMFYGRLAATENRMIQNLRRLGWTGKASAYRRVIRAIARAAPDVQKSFLKKNVLNLQAEKLRLIHADLKTGALDPNEIEDGVHELRRQVREVLLTFTTYHGMFYLDDAVRLGGLPEKGRGPLKWLVPETVGLMKNPIALPANGYLQLVHAVKDLGDLKAGDGIREFIAKALEEMPSEMRARVAGEVDALSAAITNSGEIAGSMAQTRAEARRQFEELLSSRVLLELANYLDQVAKRL